MQLFPVNYITFDFINFQSFILLSPPSTPPQPIINLQSTLGRIVQSTNGDESLIFTSHT